MEHETIIENTAVDAFGGSQDGSESDGDSEGTSNVHENVSYVTWSKEQEIMVTNIDNSLSSTRARMAEHRCQGSHSATQT